MSSLLNAKKSCLKQNHLLKVHYALPDGREMVEEYDTNTDVLTRRAWKLKNAIGDGDDWSIEVGDPERTVLMKDGSVIQENSSQVREFLVVFFLHCVWKVFLSQPFIVKRITKRNIEWRIRNMPYPLEVYSVTADADNCSLVVRTTNKKYFKKLSVPDLERANLKPEQDRIKFTHQFNTLIITVSKSFFVASNS